MRPFTVTLPTSSAQMFSGQGYVTFISFCETGGSATATVALYDGATANGQLLAEYTLAASGATMISVGHMHLPFQSGLYAKISGSGTAAGAISMHRSDSQAEWVAWIEALSAGN